MSNAATNGKIDRRKGPRGRNNRAGNRSKLTTQFIHNVEKLAAQGLNQRQIATILNVGACTISIWKAGKGRLEEKFQKALAKGEAEGVRRRLARIEKAGIKGSWQADAWMLERRQPEQFGRNDRMKLSNPDGTPISNTTVIAPTVVFVQPQKEELPEVIELPAVENGNGEIGDSK